jgi:hypothetical protein
MLTALIVAAHALPPRYLTRLAMGMMAIVGSAGALILSLSLGQTHNGAPSLLPFYEKLMSTILGVSASGNPDVMIGAGPKIALFEIVRVLSPSLILATVLLFALTCLTARKESRTTLSVACTTVLGPVLPAVIAGIALAGIMLTGIPFIHRAGFFLWILGAAAFAYAATPSEKGTRGRGPVVLAIALCSVYLFAALVLGYDCTLIQACPDQPFLDAALPFYAAAAAVVAALAATGILAAWRGGQPARAFPAIALVSIFAFEFAVSRAFFMPYAYGDASTRVVTHLSARELGLAGHLRDRYNEPMLLSDPVTLANMSALTGLNGMVGFSNLDTMQPHVEQALRSWLGSTLYPSSDQEQAGSGCAPEGPLELTARHGNAAAFNYALARRHRPDLSGAQVLDQFGYRPALLAQWRGAPGPIPPETRDDDDGPLHQWLLERRGARKEPDGILLIVDSRTLAWQRGVDSRALAYGTALAPLPESLAESLARRCNVTFNDGYFLLIRFPL